jgi:hypothetical protein
MMERGRDAVCSSHEDKEGGLGAEYPDSLTSMKNLAHAYKLEDRKQLN